MPHAGPTAVLLIDGHNLLYALRPKFAAELADGHPGRAAREALAVRLLAAFPPPGPPVRLYFDGAEALEETRSERLTVIYPGGAGEQLADRAILAELSRGTTGRPAPVVVVTRDHQLARRARKRGAEVMDPVEFFEACLAP